MTVNAESGLPESTQGAQTVEQNTEVREPNLDDIIDSPGQEVEEEPKEEVKEEPKATGLTQAEVDRIVKSRLARQQRQFEAQLAQMQQQRNQPQLTASDFGDDVAGWIEYETKRQAEKRFQEWQTQQAQAVQRNQVEAKRAEEWNQKVAEAETKYPDFREKVSTMGQTIELSDELFEAIQESPYGVDLTYYLVNHPDEADKLSTMNPQAATRHLLRLEMQFSQQQQAPAPAQVVQPPVQPRQAPVISRAPAPLAQVRTKPAGGGAMSLEDFWKTI